MTAAPQAGDIVMERFRLERPLASGAMGDVWAARVVGTKEKVAVKLARGEGVVRARKEAAALAKLEHSGIVELVASGDHAEGHAVVMRLLDGVPLSNRVAASPLTVMAAMDTALQLAEALAHAHERGVVHRDVKASNAIVVKRRGRDQVVLIDFGLGLVAGSPRVSSGDVVLGSCHTMPPEQVRGLTAGPRADIYSLGALLFRMVCGQYPFHASSPVQVLAMHAHASIPGFEDRAKRTVKVPDGLEALVGAMLSKDPEGRPDASQVAEQLTALMATPPSTWMEVHAASGEVNPDAAPPTPPPAPGPSLQLRAAAAAGVVVLAILMAWWLTT